MLLLVLIAVIGSALGGVDERIIGGVPAAVGEFPHQISLRYRQYHTCGGSILNPSYILTAAHCVEGRAYPPDFTVVTGSIQLLAGGQSHAVQSIVFHEKFAQSHLNNDVAIIKLQRPMTFNQYQKPIRLPNSDTPSGVLLTVSGWGLTAYPSNTSPNYLQKMLVNSWSNAECQRWHDYGPGGRAIDTIYPGMLCAFNRLHIGICKGDSGGPLVVYDNEGPVQVGVVSWVWRYCAQGVPDVYARVHYYLDWIHEHTNNELL
ncbi:trypsin-1-like [Ctenocephalides felis]|nr:trypsin-1-like [Ctenocephalides felis]